MDKSAIYRALGMLDVLAEYTESVVNAMIVNVIETIENALKDGADNGK